MIKRAISMLLVLLTLLSLCSCGSSIQQDPQESSGDSEGKTAEVIQPSPQWQYMESIGKVTTVDGIPYVTVTVDNNVIFGTPYFKEKDNDGQGERYESRTFNNDGTVTFIMNQAQYENMLSWWEDLIDKQLSSICNHESYGIDHIDRNEDMTVFEIHLSGNEKTSETDMTVFDFVFCNYFYGIFTGLYEADTFNLDDIELTLNMYNADGELIS